MLKTSLRTHSCGELRKSDAGARVVLSGWVESVRDHGGLLFFDLRDRYGKTQCMVHPDQAAAHEVAKTLRGEFSVKVSGAVVARPAANVNSRITTGEIEVRVEHVEVLNVAAPPPIEIDDDVEAALDLRLRYRYLDLRRPAMLKRLVQRHEICQLIRKALSERCFVEVETPILTRSTPEGARDYLIPSRVQPGNFFALPQSPQLFKQLLMVAGLDRYFQIVRCFRDEDLRADRQPEFTQLDLEMSYVDEQDVQDIIEEVMAEIMSYGLGLKLPRPLPRMNWNEAIGSYGSDKPETRFGLLIQDVSDLAGSIGFQVFAKALDGGGVVKAILVPGGAAMSRKDIDGLGQVAIEAGAKGLAWVKHGAEGLAGPVAKFLGSGPGKATLVRLGFKEGDLALFGAGPFEETCMQLGVVRLHLGKTLGLVDESRYDMFWVTDFPLFEKHPEFPDRLFSRHHPFTSPKLDQLDGLEKDPMSAKARAYDLILNGHEIGGGSIRIHRRDMQQRVFDLLGIGQSEADEKFGFLLEAFGFGAPPHGGIALGLDRIMMILTGASSIRDVIAFPKTMKATCLLTRAPSEVDEAQLEELGIQLSPKVKAARQGN